MVMKCMMPLLSAILILSLSCPVFAVEQQNEQQDAASYLREQGIMIGDQNGQMNLDSCLTRAQLAAVLTRLNEASENILEEQAFYTEQCRFSDVPDWARPYVGYCYANGLMVGYDASTFGAENGVTPQAACTVVLRYLGLPEDSWDYSTACEAAISLDLTTVEATAKAEISRGDLAIMLYRALDRTGKDVQETGNTASGIISSYKGTALSVGERSGLILSDSNQTSSVVSSDSGILSVEQVSGHWVAVAVSPGTAVITATTSDGRSGTLTFTVTPTETEAADTGGGADTSANTEIRNTMVDLINQVRREHGVPELVVNQALMDAAQDCASQHFTKHDNRYECQTAIRYGYSHGFGSNLTWFSGASRVDVARVAVNNWVNSPGHLQTMITSRYEDLGVGVSIQDGIAYCYMFAGDPDSYNAYG